MSQKLLILASQDFDIPDEKTGGSNQYCAVWAVDDSSYLSGDNNRRGFFPTKYKAPIAVIKKLGRCDKIAHWQCATSFTPPDKFGKVTPLLLDVQPCS